MSKDKTKDTPTDDIIQKAEEKRLKDLEEWKIKMIANLLSEKISTERKHKYELKKIEERIQEVISED